MANEVLWNENYGIGVDYVDNAHKKLFSILRHIMNHEGMDDEKREWTSRETITYLKNYTLQHFQQEEAYMQSIGYEGYEIHKYLHDNLRDVAIPALEKELESNNYDEESVNKLVAVLNGWLMGHILVEDRAISGAVSSRYKELLQHSDVESINQEFARFIKETSRIEISVKNKHYEGQSLGKERSFEFTYSCEGNEDKSVIFAGQEEFVLSLVSALTGKKIDKFTKDTAAMCLQFLSFVGRAIVTLLVSSQNVKCIGAKIFNTSEFEKRFAGHYPEYSYLWKSDAGDMALIIL